MTLALNEQGDTNMSILDQLLGGSNDDSSNSNAHSSDFGADVGTDPAFGFAASDILHSMNMSSDSDGGDSDSNSFTGIGNIGLGFAAPTFVGVSHSEDSASQSTTDSHDSGGLLGGLL
jgi:hypothetical protein